MGIIGRLGNIIKGKANKALDSMEDPTEQLDLSIRKKDEALRLAKKESASLIGSVMQKENKLKEAEAELLQFDSAIKRALANNDEAAAEKILLKRKTKEADVNRMKLDYDKTKEAADKIKANITRLDAEISELKSNSEHLKARYKTAQAQGKVNELLADLDSDSNISISDIEQKVAAAENYSNGLSSYNESDEDADIAKYMTGSPDTSSLKDELDKYR